MNRYMRFNRNNRRTTNFYASVLIFQLFQHILELEHKPPATLFFVAINLIIHYLARLKSFVPRELYNLASNLLRITEIRRACLHPRLVLSGHRYRLLVSSFVHADDLHLAYNLTSFLYKGLTLESYLGTLHFLALVLYLSFTAHGIYILVALIMRPLGFPHIMDNCLVGFSGVIFGLKTILNSSPAYARRAETIFGFSLPAGRSPWLELVLASVLSPRVSFLGHLSGILAGLLYIYGMRFVTNLLRKRARRRSQGRYAR